MTHDPDHLHFGDFLTEVRRRAPQGTASMAEAKLRNPFEALLTEIRSGPETMEHRVLAHFLSTVINDPIIKSTFRTADLAALSSVTLQLFSAFLDDLINGRYDQKAMRAALAKSKPMSADSGGLGSWISRCVESSALFRQALCCAPNSSDCADTYRRHRTGRNYFR